MTQEDELHATWPSRGRSTPAGHDAEDPQRDEQPADNGQRRAAVGPEEDQLAGQPADDKYNPDNDGNNPTHGRKSIRGTGACQKDSTRSMPLNCRTRRTAMIVAIEPPT